MATVCVLTAVVLENSNLFQISVFTRICALFFHSPAETCGKQPETRGCRPPVPQANDAT